MEYTAKQILDTFINFFTENGHTRIKNSSIVPENDPTLLFINAGMAPIKKCFTGEEQPVSKRMCNVQTCIRTNDIESVGDRHHLTSFNMLGSWSIGDYFKEGAISYAFKLLMEGFKIPKEKLYATVFSGDEKLGLPADEESIGYWEKVGIDPSHIIKLPFEDNFWRMGDGEGPCGPCTEVFFDTGDEQGESYEKSGFFDTKKRYLEIWNAGVFMEYYQNLDKTYSKLKFKSVDTGSGLERMLLTLNGLDTIYDTEIFVSIMNYLRENSKHPNERSLRIICEHIRTSVIILNAKVEPSNVKAGYILRRLMRRALRHLRTIEANDDMFEIIASKTIDNMERTGLAPEWNFTKDELLAKFKVEQDKFSKMLSQGLKVFNEYIEDANNIENGCLKTELVFKLYDTFGFPLEITTELAQEHNIRVDEVAFEKLLEQHKQESRGANQAVFKSGLADHDPETIKLHTATHLLHASLKKFLGDDVHQMGSNITPERLRFDFNFPRKLTPEELKQIEDYVNDIIKEGVDVVREEMSPEEAKNSGAIGLFDNKYGDKVSVYTIGKYSKEICSGPHVNNTKELVRFKIKKEESSSANVRRIKAVLLSE